MPQAVRAVTRSLPTSTNLANPEEFDPLLDVVQGIARQLVALTTSALLHLDRPRGRGVTLPEYRVLVLTSLAEITAPSELADELQVTRAAVAQILGRLEEKRLIRRRSHEDDGRRSRVSVTPSGKAVVEAVARERARRLRPALRELSSGERTELLRALQRFERALISPKPQSPRNTR